MNDIFPQYKGPNGRITVTDYNALVRAVRRATPQPGPGVRINRGEGGSVITAVPKKGGGGAAVAPDKLHPFKLKVVDAGTKEAPDYRHLVYIPEGSLYCSGVEGDCKNTRYEGDWYCIDDENGVPVGSKIAKDIYLVGRFAFGDDNDKLVLSATYVVTTNPDERYLSSLGEYSGEDAWRYFKCRIGSMTGTGVASQLVCSSLMFMALTDNDAESAEVPFEVREVGNEAGGKQYIVYLPPYCVSMKDAACSFTSNARYAVTEADKERYTFRDTDNWYYVRGNPSNQILLQYAYKENMDANLDELWFCVTFGNFVEANLNYDFDWIVGATTERGEFPIADITTGSIRQITIGAVRIYRQNFSTSDGGGGGDGDGLTDEEKEQLKEELLNEITEELDEAVQSATGAANAAAGSAGAAANAASSAQSSAEQAQKSAADANAAKDAAKSAQSAAESAKAGAESSAQTATDAANQAAGSAGTAANAASAAQRSAESAADAATHAQNAAEELSGAVEDANAAAEEANKAAEEANSAKENAEKAAENAETATENANKAAESANQAAEELTYESLLGVMQDAISDMLADGSLEEALGKVAELSPEASISASWGNSAEYGGGSIE